MKSKKRMILIIVLVVAICIAAWFSYSLAVRSKDQHEKNAIKEAVERSAVQCCSIEGTYPQDLDYLKEHYGLLIDEKQYIVIYEVIGSNIKPEITVLEKGN